MNAVDRATKTLKSASVSKSNISQLQLRETFALLQTEANEKGLEEKVMEVCVNFLQKKCKNCMMIQNVFKCLIPKTFVPDLVLRRILHWIAVNYRTYPVRGITFALQWVGGVLEFGVCNKLLIDECYHIFFAMMDYNIMGKVACWLVHRLTKPDDVTRSAVWEVLEMKRKMKSARHLDCLLWLFKNFRPECVPEQVHARSMQSRLQLSEEMRRSLEGARMRAGQLSLPSHEPGRVWRVENTGKAKRRCYEAVPGVFYVKFGSSLYQEHKRSVLDISEWKQMAENQLEIEIPSNVMSLLQNPMGRYLLVFRDVSVHQRLSYSLFHVLYNVLIEDIWNVEAGEAESLLEAVIDLQESMQQGVPAVSHFLGLYLLMWDGLTLRSQLLRLLPWITFSSYPELRDIILTHMETIFITSDISGKCQILESLGRLLQNQIYLYSCQQQGLFGATFLGAPPCRTDIDAINQLSVFMSSLCTFALTVNPRHPLLLLHVLMFYEQLSDVEEESGLAIWSLIPPVAVYQCIFYFSAPLLNKLCGLLLRYHGSTYTRVRQQGLQNILGNNIEYTNMYINDFVNCLWNDAAFQKKGSYIFYGLKIDCIKKLSETVNVPAAFNLRKHSPILQTVIGRDPTLLNNDKGYENFVRRYWPNIMRLLHTVLRDAKNDDSKKTEQ